MNNSKDCDHGDDLYKIGLILGKLETLYNFIASKVDSLDNQLKTNNDRFIQGKIHNE